MNKKPGGNRGGGRQGTGRSSAPRSYNKQGGDRSDYRGNRTDYRKDKPNEDGPDFRNDRPGGEGPTFRNGRPGGERSNFRNGRPGGERSNFRNDRPSGERSNFRNDRPGGERSNFRNDRPGGERSNFRNDRPGGERSNFRNDRPSGERSNFRNDRPSGEQAGFRNDRAGGDRPNFRNDRPSGERSNFRNDRPGGERSNFRNDRPSGERSNFRNDRPSGNRPNFRNDRSGTGGRPGFRKERDMYAPPPRQSTQEVFDGDMLTLPDESRAVSPENLLIGRNPIREALKAGRHFEALYVQKGELNGSAREIVRMAKEQRVQIREAERRAMSDMAPGHQGLIAVVSAHQYADIEDVFAKAKEKGEEPLLVILDGITDPHNMGAIARTAECCGAHGLVLCERRAVGMTPGSAKAAAGAFEYLPVVRVPNIVKLIEQLQKRNVWVYAAAAEAKQNYDQTDFSGPVAIVIGDEGGGVSRLALEKCDGGVAIPIKGNVGSLNASVAAGVILYDIVRQRKR